MAQTDEELAALETRASKGDRRALSELCEAYQPRLVRFCARFLGLRGARDPGHTAEDVAQDAILRVYAKYRSGGNFQGFLYTVAVHLCIDERKRQVKEPKLIDLGDGDANIVMRSETNPTPDRVAANREVHREVHRVFERCRSNLTDEERTVFDLFVLSEETLSFRKIGKLIGRATHTVISRYKSARLKLARCLKEAGICE
ncbi:MAG: RNA polymerase sigma factor [Phycisphaerae bacterium]